MTARVLSVVRETLNGALHGMPKYRQKQNPVSCAYCKAMFSNTELCNWHVELVKQCRRRRRRLTKRAVANLKTNCGSKEYLEEVDMKEMIGVKDDPRMEVDDEQSKTQPLKIKINLSRKKLVTSNVNSVKQETTSGFDETREEGDFKLLGVWVTFSCGYIFFNAPM